MQTFDLDQACQSLILNYGGKQEKDYFILNSRFGPLNISIYSHKETAKKKNFRLPWIALQFTGVDAKPHGCWGSFNPFSHKWNILIDCDNYNTSAKNCYLELAKRLEWVMVI
jgi:hypothetical protein